MTDGPCYLYGVIRADDAGGLPGISGVAGNPVTSVTSGALAAVVGELDSIELRPTRADVLAHADVLQAVVDHCDVVPLSFGHIYHSAAQVQRDLLDRDGGALRHVLDELHDAVELQVKASSVEATVGAEIVRSDRKVRRLQGATDHGRQIELGRRFAAALDARRQADAARLLDRMSPIAIRASLGDPPGEFGVVGASFLVPRETVTAFLDEVDRATDADPALTVRTSGPMAPFSFVGDVFAGAA